MTQLSGQAIETSKRNQTGNSTRTMKIRRRTNKTASKRRWKYLENNQVMHSKKVYERFTKDDQNVENEFNRFLSSVGKSTMEKIQLLARKFNYVPAQDPFIPRNYPVSEQFSFTTVECSQVKDIVTIPNNKSPGITSIINASLTSGVFPAFWNIALKSGQFLKMEIMKKPVIIDQFRYCQYSLKYVKE